MGKRKARRPDLSLRASSSTAVDLAEHMPDAHRFPAFGRARLDGDTAREKALGYARSLHVDPYSREFGAVVFAAEWAIA